ncbi:MAG TPA: BlaI/MecI/CopY family transcriptional regulator [Candidatus Angelobacter sp.]|jgi:predicted transcriptional regulator|nr:BlaI/MecI/CopY family transcriptional regulator [Candidatus Angelobacter sp.]
MWLKKNFAGKRASLEQLGALETEIMDRIWKGGEVAVRDLHDDLSGRLAYTTIMTTLDRLYKKGLLSRRKEGKAFFYRAVLSEQQYQERVAQHLFGMVLKGTGDSQVVLSRFVDAISETDRQMLDQLDELVKAKRRALRRTE